MKPIDCLPFFLVALASPLFAELPVAELKRETPVNFAIEVYPFLKQNCLACHNSTKAKADLILESPQDMIRGGDSGPSIEPGNGKDSFLFTTAAHLEEPTMPPANNKSKARNLNPQELALLQRWIDEGAKGDVVSTQAPASWTHLKGPQPIYTAAISPEGRFAVAGRGQEIDLYDLRLARQEASLVDKSLEHPTAHRDLVQSIAFSPDGRVASGGYRNVKIWKRSPAQLSEALALPEEATAIASTPDASRFAIGLKSGALLLLTPQENSLTTVEVKDHNGAITDLAFSADGKTLFSSSTDKTIRKRAVDQPKKSDVITLPNPVGKLTLFAEDKLLAAAGSDQIIRLFYTDLKTPAKPAPAPAPAPANQSPAQAWRYLNHWLTTWPFFQMRRRQLHNCS